MSNLEMWSLIVGFFLPLAIAFVMQQHWHEQLKAVVGFVICAIAGAGTAYFQGEFTGRRFIEAGLVILVTAMATYRNFWKPTGVAPTIENKTTFTSPPAP